MFRIKRIKDGSFIIYRPCKKGWHSHFTTHSKATTCLKFIKRGVMPDNDYYIESCKRLLTTEEFNRLGEGRKPVRYINQPRGRQ